MKSVGKKLARSAIVSAVEPLELRRLLAGSVTGVVFEDVNGNGVRDAGEPGLAGRTVKFVGGGYGSEVTATTNSTGNYTFNNQIDGPGYLSHVAPSGSVFTAPPNGFAIVNVVPNQTVTAAPLGSRVIDQNVYLDQSFGTRGESVISASTAVNAVATRQLADGRILLAGVRDNRATVTRLTSTGALDITFGNGAGYVQPNLPAGFVIQSMALLSDERIVLGGQTPTSGDLEVAVLTTAGALDSSFAGDGTTTIDFGGSFDVFVELARMPGDKIAVVGSRADANSDRELLVAVLRPTGAFDSNFSSDGREVYNFNAQVDTPTGVAVESDGQIVVTLNRELSMTRKIGVVTRINTNGTVDFTFGSGGTRILELSNTSLSLDDIAIQPNDRAVIVATTMSVLPVQIPLDASVFRLNAFGASDTSFNFTGRRDVQIGTSALQYQPLKFSVAVNAAGNIAVGGIIRPASLEFVNTQPLLLGLALITPAGESELRFLRNGDLVHQFANNGLTDTAPNIILQADNRIIATQNLVTPGRMALLRTGDQTPRANLTGTVFDDANNNGIRDGNETGSEGRTVFLDVNNNGERDSGEPFAVTDASGNFAIDSVVADDYTMMLTVPEGFAQTYPVQPLSVGISLAPGQQLTGQNFGLRQVPPDLVANPGGPYNVNEGGSVQVFGSATGGTITAYEWDFNYDGVTFTTDSTQQNPLFSAADLDGVGTRTVALRAKSGTLSTSPIATTTVNLLNVSPTAVFTNSGPIVAGQTASVAFSQTNDPSAADRAAGFKYSFDFNNDGTFEIIDSTTANPAVPANVIASPGSYTVRGRIADKDNGFNEYLTTIVVNTAPPPGQISGLVFNDIDRDGTQDAGEGGLAARNVFIDADNDGIFDTGEASAVTDTSGNFTISNVVPGTYTVRQVVPAGLIQTLPAGNAARSATVTSGNTTSGVNFATATPPAGGATLRGTVFLDVDRDGVFDTGEQGVANRTIYLDLNNNVTRESNEPQTTTNSSGLYEFAGLAAGTYKIRQILPAGFIQTTPSNNFGNNATVSGTQVRTGLNFGTATTNITPTGATIRGTVYLDVDRDGVFDSSEQGVSGRTVYLDLNNNNQRNTNEPQTTTNSSGLYEFAGLAAGAYKIRQILPSGFIQTIPFNNFGNNATVTANQTLNGINFGTATSSTQPTGASISGTVFFDSNRNAIFNSGEQGVGGRTIYLDLNNNNQRDGSEPQTTTNSSGVYTFSGLAAGTYKVRQILPSGFIQTSPGNNFGNNVTLSTNQNRTGVNFGTFSFSARAVDATIATMREARAIRIDLFSSEPIM